MIDCDLDDILPFSPLSKILSKALIFNNAYGKYRLGGSYGKTHPTDGTSGFSKIPPHRIEVQLYIENSYVFTAPLSLQESVWSASRGLGMMLAKVWQYLPVGKKSVETVMASLEKNE